MKAIMRGKGSALFANGLTNFSLQEKTECCRQDRRWHRTDDEQRKSVDHAYFTLFESIDSKPVADALLKTAESWAKNRGMKFLRVLYHQPTVTTFGVTGR